MKSKKEIEFWNEKQIFDYLVKSYHVSSLEISDTNFESSVSKKLKRLLTEYDLIRPNEEWHIAKDIAIFIVEELMYDYMNRYLNKDHEKQGKQAEMRRKKRLEDFEEKSKEVDRNITGITDGTSLQKFLYKEALTDPLYDRDGTLRKALRNAPLNKKRKALLYTLSNGSTVPKKSLDYHLPDLTVDELSDEKVDRIIERMMVREIIKMFFEFNEVQYRTDLYERSAKIVEKTKDGLRVSEGYSELTKRLENPLQYAYVKRKKEK